MAFVKQSLSLTYFIKVSLINLFCSLKDLKVSKSPEVGRFHWLPQPSPTPIVKVDESFGLHLLRCVCVHCETYHGEAYTFGKEAERFKLITFGKEAERFARI